MTKLLYGYSCLYAKYKAGSHFHQSKSDRTGKKIADQLTGKKYIKSNVYNPVYNRLYNAMVAETGQRRKLFFTRVCHRAKFGPESVSACDEPRWPGYPDCSSYVALPVTEIRNIARK